MPRLSLFQSLPPKRGTIDKIHKRITNNKKIEEDLDTKKIKEILRKRYSLSMKDKVTVTRVEKENKVGEHLILLPRFRVNITLVYDPDCIWKSFWVEKDNGNFNFNSRICNFVSS